MELKPFDSGVDCLDDLKVLAEYYTFVDPLLNILSAAFPAQGQLETSQKIRECSLLTSEELAEVVQKEGWSDGVHAAIEVFCHLAKSDCFEGFNFLRGLPRTEEFRLFPDLDNRGTYSVSTVLEESWDLERAWSHVKDAASGFKAEHPYIVEFGKQSLIMIGSPWNILLQLPKVVDTALWLKNASADDRENWIKKQCSLSLNLAGINDVKEEDGKHVEIQEAMEKFADYLDKLEVPETAEAGQSSHTPSDVEDGQKANKGKGKYGDVDYPTGKKKIEGPSYELLLRKVGEGGEGRRLCADDLDA